MRVENNIQVLISNTGFTLFEKSLMKTDLYYGLDQMEVGRENLLHTRLRRK